MLFNVPLGKGRRCFDRFLPALLTCISLRLQLSSFPNIQCLIHGCGQTSLFALSPSDSFAMTFWQTYRWNTKLDTITMQFSEVHLSSFFSAALIVLHCNRKKHSSKGIIYVYRGFLMKKRISEGIVICSSL